MSRALPLRGVFPGYRGAEEGGPEGAGVRHREGTGGVKNEREMTDKLAWGRRARLVAGGARG